jgi:hypothetical protein
MATGDDAGIIKAFKNIDFLDDRVARSLRIFFEYLEPEARFGRLGIINTVVFLVLRV